MDSSPKTDRELYDKVRDVVIEVLKPNESELRDESRFVEDLGADSLDRVTMLMALEDAFEREISDEDAEKLVSIEATVAYIKEKLAAA
jgi:acyl carrier protein